jgi:hypothetical protein
MEIKKATRKTTKLRLGLSGASGFGKTYSALLLAKGMVEDTEKIAVIDTENGSASLYSHLFDFNVIELQAPYSPERYIEAIKTCERAGMEVIIIDSITHEWDGSGGCLEEYEKLGGRYQDWAKITPRHRAFIDAILQSKCHVITTVRRKQDYDMVKGDKGKLEVQKVGTKEVTREGFEYEVTINFELINDKHLAKASKDRTGLYMGRPEFTISEATGKELKKWCETGVDEAKQAREELEALQELYSELLTEDVFNEEELKKYALNPSWSLDTLKKAYAKVKPLKEDRLAHLYHENDAA